MYIFFPLALPSAALKILLKNHSRNIFGTGVAAGELAGSGRGELVLERG